MATVVRWLGAFKTSVTLASAVAFELSGGNARQVAAEPLFFGESRLSVGRKSAQIGLRVDLSRTVFVRGWLGDAYTWITKDGCLKPSREKSLRKQGFKDLGRLLAAAKPFSRLVAGDYRGHGEVVLDYVKYDAVVVLTSASAEVKEKARRIAAAHGLPLVHVMRHRGERD